MIATGIPIYRNSASASIQTKQKPIAGIDALIWFNTVARNTKTAAPVSKSSSSNNSSIGNRSFAHAKPSSRLSQPSIGQFGASKHKTAFGTAYANNAVPCRLSHGSVKHKLSWSQPVSALAYDPLLITFFEGIRETRHPYRLCLIHSCPGLRFWSVREFSRCSKTSRRSRKSPTSSVDSLCHFAPPFSAPPSR